MAECKPPQLRNCLVATGWAPKKLQKGPLQWLAVKDCGQGETTKALACYNQSGPIVATSTENLVLQARGT